MSFWPFSPFRRGSSSGVHWNCSGRGTHGFQWSSTAMSGACLIASVLAAAAGHPAVLTPAPLRPDTMLPWAWSFPGPPSVCFVKGSPLKAGGPGLSGPPDLRASPWTGAPVRVSALTWLLTSRSWASWEFRNQINSRGISRSLPRSDLGWARVAFCTKGVCGVPITCSSVLQPSTFSSQAARWAQPFRDRAHRPPCMFAASDSPALQLGPRPGHSPHTGITWGSASVPCMWRISRATIAPPGSFLSGPPPLPLCHAARCH